ncbi:AT-hook motif nuclear-localized protein 10-like [Curcuma longa]|uniref:AT-hook motif nuclear-localized protein 10-like n=1 Tax=Curcuma longa TaxID=136217 RepID=UPI003D9E535E
MEGSPEQSIANTTESSLVNLQSNPTMQQSLAMHGGPLSCLSDDPSFLRLLSSSSAAHPQPSPSYQGNSGGGGIPEAIGCSSIAQTANSPNSNTGEPEAKRKRGRPRKYGPDGSVLAPSQPSALLSTSGMMNAPKRRGRPLGSCKKQQMVARESAELQRFLLIRVKEGEDVFAKILSFPQLRSQTISIISATGVASKVTIFHPTVSGGRLITYEGWLEILSLTGSFENPGDQQSLTGRLSVSLADAKGNVLGGRIAGPLLAASRVQVVVARFVDGMMEFKDTNAPEVVPAPNLVSGGTTNTGNSSISVPSGDPRNPPPIQSTATCSNINSLNYPIVVKLGFDKEGGGDKHL